MTADMTEIMDRRSGRRPTRSIRSQGMKLAMRNHVWRNPDMSALR